jgi:hypothetical protein
MPRPSPWDDERHGRIVPPPTLPVISLPDIDREIIADERRATADRIAERRTIRQGLDAWAAINKAESFEGWKRIGAALAIGKAHALRITGANAAWGRNYSRAFSDWLKAHRFDCADRRLSPSVRSVAILLHENANAIEVWRATLPERQRKRLIHPLSNVRRWKAATGQYEIQRSRDLKWQAQYAWRRFVACVEALPADQAAPLWQTVAEAAAHQAFTS